MFYHLLSTRAIRVGIAFFMLVVGGSLLYGWYAYETTKTEFAYEYPDGGIDPYTFLGL